MYTLEQKFRECTLECSVDKSYTEVIYIITSKFQLDYSEFIFIKEIHDYIQNLFDSGKYVFSFSDRKHYKIINQMIVDAFRNMMKSEYPDSLVGQCNIDSHYNCENNEVVVYIQQIMLSDIPDFNKHIANK